MTNQRYIQPSVTVLTEYGKVFKLCIKLFNRDNPYTPKYLRVKLIRTNKINNKIQSSNFFIAN